MSGTGWAAAAQAGGEILGGVISNQISNAATNRQNNRNATRAMEAWAIENAYNLPNMQMARLKMAGLNPMLIYGQNGGGAAGSSIDMPAGDAPPPMENLGNAVSNAVGSYYQIKNTMADTAMKEKSLEATQAQMNQANASTVNLLAQSAKTKQETEQSSELFKTVADQATANVNKTLADTDVSVANSRKTIQDTEQQKDLFPAQRDALNLANAQRKLDIAFANNTLKFRTMQEKYQAKNLIMQHMQNWENLTIAKQQIAINKLAVDLAGKGLSASTIQGIIQIIGAAVLKK